MLDLISWSGERRMACGITTVDIKTHKPLGTAVIDTWGYILNAYLMFDIAEELLFIKKKSSAPCGLSRLTNLSRKERLPMDMLIQSNRCYIYWRWLIFLKVING